MHLPYPRRKLPTVSPFLQQGSSSNYPGLVSIPRRYRQQAIAIAAFLLIGFIWLFAHDGGFQRSASGSGTGSPNHKPSGHPPTVIVTVLDEETFGKRYTGLVKENRKLYADKHGYATFFPNVGDYDLRLAPASWTKVVAMRHALTKFPDATYFWYIDVDVFIMNPQLTIESDIMAPAKLEEKMVLDHPVVPPDSIIHTFSHLKGTDVDFALTQDKEGLSTNSWVIKNSKWSRFFLELWFDPIYRSYNFKRADTHALEHIVQWHPTVLFKLAIIPQRIINSYDTSEKGDEYASGDLVVRFPKCAKSIGSPTCDKDAEPYASTWRSAYRD